MANTSERMVDRRRIDADNMIEDVTRELKLSRDEIDRNIAHLEEELDMWRARLLILDNR